MKKINAILGFSLMFGALGFGACNQIGEEVITPEAQEMTLTVKATTPTTKTAIDCGNSYATTWLATDKLGVYFKTGDTYQTNKSFSAAAAGATTTFSGSATIAASTDYSVWAYYPYSDLSQASPATESNVRIAIPADQSGNSLTSFDPAADLMIAKPQTFNVASSASEATLNMQFARILSYLKIVFTTDYQAAEVVEKVKVSFTNSTDAEVAVAGRREYNISTGAYGDWFSSTAYTLNFVSADYDAADNYVINGTNAAYFVVSASSVPIGDKITFDITTTNYTISKTITIASKDMDFAQGNVTVLNIALAEANYTMKAGAALPFSDDFAWVTTTAYKSESTAIPTADLVEKGYTTSYKIFPSATGGAVKLGTSDALGYLTTDYLDLSSAFTVIVKAKTYVTDTSQVSVAVGSEMAVMSTNLTADFVDYYFNCNAASATTQVKIGIATKRGYIDEISIVSGTILPAASVVATTADATNTATTAEAGEGKTATLNGSYVAQYLGESDTVTCGFEYKLSSAESYTSVTATPTNTTPFSVDITGLTTDAEYTFRAWASLDGGTTKVYGATKTFTPTLSSGDVTSKTVTYTVSTTTTVTTSGTAPTGSSATYSQTYNTKSQMTSGYSVTYTLSGYAGATIKAITLSMHSNSSTGAGTLSVKAGTTAIAGFSTAAAFNTASWNGAWSKSYVDVAVAMTNANYLIQAGENVVLKIAATANSLYCESIKITYEN